MAAVPIVFDHVLRRRHLDRAAAGFSSASYLTARAAEDLVMRLEAINRHFDRAADLGARDRSFARALARSGAAGKIGWLVETDISWVMLADTPGPRLVLDEERLPFAPASLDLIASSLALHWTNDLVGALIQIRMALRPDGLFLGALLGGATLTELRQVLLAAELEIAGGAGPRISPFADAQDAGGLMQRAGFALPVVDVDTVTVRYDHPLALMADLRAMGETNALVDRPAKPLTRSVLARASEIYADRFADPDGRIAATFEIITLTGWAPHESQQRPLQPGSAKMRLADALHAVERPAGETTGR